MSEPIKKDPATGRWYFTVDVGLRGERRRQVHRRGFPTKRAARVEYDRLRADRTKQIKRVDPSDLTVAQFLLERELPALRMEVTAGTLTTYRALARRVKTHRVGSIKLQGLRTPDLEEMYADLRDKQGLSATTVRMVHGFLHRAFADACRWDLLRANPAASARQPKAVRPELEVWTQPQLQAFLAATRDREHWPVWAYLSGTGNRRGEALGLRWQDVNLEAARVRIARQLVPLSPSEHDGSRYTIEPPKTSKGLRTISLGPETVAALRTQRRTQNELRLRLGAGWRGEDWGDLVFTGPDGSPLEPTSVSYAFTRAVKATDPGPQISLHGLRHTHATVLLNAGVPVPVVSHRLGHANVSITLNTYYHFIPGADTAAAELGDVPLGANVTGM